MLRFLFVFLTFLGTNMANAQVEMATNFRGEGKIYVVIAIILLILAGFFFLLFKLDKRAKQLEEQIGEKE